MCNARSSPTVKVTHRLILYIVLNKLQAIIPAKRSCGEIQRYFEIPCQPQKLPANLPRIPRLPAQAPQATCSNLSGGCIKPSVNRVIAGIRETFPANFLRANNTRQPSKRHVVERGPLQRHRFVRASSTTSSPRPLMTALTM